MEEESKEHIRKDLLDFFIKYDGFSDTIFNNYQSNGFYATLSVEEVYYYFEELLKKGFPKVGWHEDGSGLKYYVRERDTWWSTELQKWQRILSYIFWHSYDPALTLKEREKVKKKIQNIENNRYRDWHDVPAFTEMWQPEFIGRTATLLRTIAERIIGQNRLCKHSSEADKFLSLRDQLKEKIPTIDFSDYASAKKIVNDLYSLYEEAL